MRCSPARHEVAPLFSLFDDTFNELQKATRHARRQFNPRFDLKESKEAYSLEGELPGIDQKDLSIEFTDEYTLTIKGRSERHAERGRRPEAVESEKAPAAEEATTSETSSVKSHQATVEDEEPANSSAAVQENTEATATAHTAEPVEAEKKPTEGHYWISERSVGEFSRSFSFPQRVDQDAVKASLKKGILSIVVPKAPAPESRRINIE